MLIIWAVSMMLLIRRWYSKTKGWFPQQSPLVYFAESDTTFPVLKPGQPAQRQTAFLRKSMSVPFCGHLRRGVNDRCGMVTGDRKKISGKLAIKIHQCTFSGTNLTILLGKMMVVVLGNSSFFILYWIAVSDFLLCHVWMWGMLAKRK